ncbi:MAG: ribonuclease N [Proteobacteria bacterium]|nr:ribonuclease N [Pseudomonadota bacterium]MBS0494530.1 ribonuclease N [Pseudomonadota bacterium]
MLKAVANRAYKAFVACALGAAVVLAPTGAYARQPVDAGPTPAIALADLPPQGRATYALIQEGGPFPYDKDGSVFGNRERQLPPHKRGYYREYTVRTPGAGNRGARRIICGGPARTPDACYYTQDHYTSFREIRQ